MNLRIPLVLLAPAAAASAQSPFLDPVQVTIGTQAPGFVTAADFTGDGINDIVTGGERLILFRGNGTAAPDGRVALTPVGLDVVGISSGDVDADGDPDILLLDAASGSPELVWYENSSSGAVFTRRSLVPDVPTAGHVQLADVDGDGDLDFVVLTLATDSLVWFENTPSLTNLVARPLAPSLNATRRFEDVDLDGLVDLIQERPFPSNGNRGVSVAFATSAGVFASPVDIFGGVTSVITSRLRDFDGDGDLDGLALRGNELVLLEATSPGVFAAPVSIGLVGGPNVDTFLDFVEDLNGDGLLDFVFLESGPFFDFSTRWVASLPGGGISSPQDILASGSILSPFDQLIDLTGDGRSDVLQFMGDRLDIAVNIAVPGGALFADQAETPTVGADHIDAAWLDVDGDGDLDILGLQSETRTLSVITNDGQGSFSPDGQIVLGGVAANTIEPHDFDGDGDDDLLLRAASGAMTLVSILRNDGNRNFQEVVVRPLMLSSLGEVQVEDLDGDGDLDLIFEDIAPVNLVRWFRNDGPGLTFTEILVPSNGITTVGDVDDDGLLDLVSMDTVQSPDPTLSVVWRRNLGSGTFSPQATLFDAFSSTVFFRSPVTLSDINSDGATDILLNQGGTIFAATAITPGSQYSLLTSLSLDSPGFPERLPALDLTADGREDLLGNFGSDTVQIYVNPGPIGMAIVAEVFASVGVSRRPQFGDAESDGDLDALGVAGGEIYVADNAAARPIGTNVCGPANATSTGFPARMAADGSVDLTEMDVTLIAQGVPVNMTGIFVASRTVGAPQPIAGSQGSICLSGSLGRFSRAQEIQNSGSEGVLRLALDVTAIPQGNGRIPILPGETWHFQAWFRDSVAPVGATSNLTDALTITF